MRWFLVLCVLGWTVTATAAEVKTRKSRGGWQLLVDGKPFLVKGVCYVPTKIGESPDGSWRDWMIVDDDHDDRIDAPEQSWVDKNGNHQRDADDPVVGDFRLMQQMGVNTIRIYHHASAEPEIQALHTNQGQITLYNHAPNKALLRDMFKTYGIRVAMGDFLGAYTAATGASWDEGTDYLSTTQKARMLKSVEAMVREFKDEPYILMWVLGNENRFSRFTHTNADKYQKEFAQFVNEAARLIHKLDPHHPVVWCDWDSNELRNSAPYIPDVDIYGINSYRALGFGDLWGDIARNLDKPVLIMEYGVSNFKGREGQVDEDLHAQVHQKAWEDIAAHAAGGSKSPAIALGGFVYEWVDQWWPDGDPWQQNLKDGWNAEWCGITSQGDGSHSPFMRHLRKTYYVYQDLWKKK